MADLSLFKLAPQTVSQLVERAEGASSDLKKLKDLIASTSVKYAERAERAEHEIGQLTPGRAINKDQLRRAIAERKDQVRKEELQRTDKERWDLLRKLKDIEESLTKTHDQFSSPARILSRSGLGSAERSRYLEQMQHSGAAEVENFAQLSVATGDRVLGAAVLSRMDALGRDAFKKSDLSRQRFADVLAGADYEAAQAALNRIKNVVREAMSENRALEAGRHQIDARSKIGLGLGRSGEEMPEGFEAEEGAAA